MRSAKAPNTLKAYATEMRTFERWCSESGRIAFPAAPETVALYLAWASTNGYTKRSRRGYNATTLQVAVASIRHRHEAANLPAPINQEVRDVMAGIVRKQARQKKQRDEDAGKNALTLEQLRRMCRMLRDDVPKDVRDRAVLLVGFASAWRRSELRALDVDDVEFEPGKGMRLQLHFSKSDQEGEGRKTDIAYGSVPYTCPVRAMKAWLKVRGDWPGPLFVRFTPLGKHMLTERLSCQSICVLLKRALALIGVDPRPYGVHSLRSGMITCAAKKKGVDLRDIMDHSGHKSVQTVMRYIKRGKFSDPLAGML